jgi:hypothetical protein
MAGLVTCAMMQRFVLAIAGRLFDGSLDLAEPTEALVGARQLLIVSAARRSRGPVAGAAARRVGQGVPRQGHDARRHRWLVRHATILEMNVESYRRRAAIERKRGTPRGGPRDNQGEGLIHAQRQSTATK